MLPCCVAALLLLVHVMAWKRGFLRFLTGRTREEDREEEYWTPPKVALGEKFRLMVQSKSLFWGLGVVLAAGGLLALGLFAA